MKSMPHVRRPRRDAIPLSFALDRARPNRAPLVLALLGALLLSACGGSDGETDQPAPLCGNGILDVGEQCDGTAFGGANCASVGAFDGGTLKCTSGCQFDTTACTPTASCADDRFAPNHSMRDAAVLPPGDHTGLVLCPVNSDFFTISVCPFGQLTTQLTIAEADGTLRVSLLSATGVPLDQGEDTAILVASNAGDAPMPVVLWVSSAPETTARYSIHAEVSGCDQGNPCEPNPCNTPPDATCNAANTGFVTYAAAGTCTPKAGGAHCEYAPTEEACVASAVCQDNAVVTTTGACVVGAAGPACARTTTACNTPPEATCNAANTAFVTYAAAGTCTAKAGTAQCEYGPTEEACVASAVCQDNAIVASTGACAVGSAGPACVLTTTSCGTDDTVCTADGKGLVARSGPMCEDAPAGPVCAYSSETETLCNKPPHLGSCSGSVHTVYSPTGACEASTATCKYDMTTQDCAAKGFSCTPAACSGPGKVCDGPIAATLGVNSTTGTFVLGVPNNTFTCASAWANAVWFHFTPSESAVHELYANNTTTTQAYSRLVVLNGTGCDPYGGQVDCGTTSAKSITRRVSLDKGVHYLIGFFTDGATYSMVDPSLSISLSSTCTGVTCPSPASCALSGGVAKCN